MNEQLDETFKYDVDHMPGQRLSLSDIKGTSKYVLKDKEGKVVSTHQSMLDAVKTRSKIGGNRTHSVVKEEVESLDELSMDTVKSYKAKVATNPPPSRTTSDILHKAIRRFAGKERAEDRIHHDEMVKMRARLGIKEETVTEGEFADSLKSRALALVKKITGSKEKPDDGIKDKEYNELSAHVNKIHPGFKLHSIGRNADGHSLNWAASHKDDKDFKHSESGVFKQVTEDAAQKNMSNAMDNIEPSKRDAARKQYESARKAGQTHAASMTLMHDRFGKTNEEVLDEAIKTEKPKHKVGDTVYATSPTNKALTMTGRVTKIGQTLTTVKHKDGSEAHYPHKLVDNDYEVLHPNPYKKLQREHLEQTGELLTLTEVKYMVENANGGVGAIAQHAGVDGQAPQNTGKAKKMMGNKASIDAIVKIISKGATPN